MLTAISPLDGRYEKKVDDLRQYFSEFGLIKYRVQVEVEWLIYLCNVVKLEGASKISQANERKLRDLYLEFSSADAKKVKDIEKTTNHDVKAVEYFIQNKLKSLKLAKLIPFVHFGCTSADINSVSYALLLKDACNDVLAPEFKTLIKELRSLAKKWKNIPMLSRTHGQAATPTTVGKEMVNFVARLEQQWFRGSRFLAKMSGATGNFSAHLSAYRDLKWPKISHRFLTKLGLTTNNTTAQIEPHDYIAELSQMVALMNTIVIDLDRDLWMYISYGYFKLKLKEGEVGSSTMPHKVNPIDFENSEGNLGLANSVLGHLAEKLPISRMQRDLSDSTVMRNLGVGFGYSLLAWKSTMKGLSKLEVNKAALKNDLENRWELLAEPIQTVMRKNGVTSAYEQLKGLTRGQKIDKETTKEFISKLKLPQSDKDYLLSLTPLTYTGLAKELTEQYLRENRI